MRARSADSYKWIALSNTTLAVLLATIDASITLIAMPDIFRGIHLDPLQPGNSFYLLWMILGYLVVTSVLVVSLGRLGDLYGRVRMYNLGFVIYTLASLLLTIDWMTGAAGADWLIVFRIVQGIGGAFLIANAVAILTDAFPANQRGLALGITNVVGISGQFLGLVLGGVLAPIDWRLIFLVSVPFGLIGTVWSYRSLRETSKPQRAPIDWWGNVTFACGLVLVMIGITYGIRPYGGSNMGWRSPFVDSCLIGGVALLGVFVARRAGQRQPDVQAAALPHPRVHVRRALELPLGRRPRRADVHADHLAAGNLAARARLQLQPDAALRGPLHAAADDRLPRRRTDLGLPLRPARLADARDRRDDRLGDRVRPARAAPDRLRLRGLRGDPAADGALDGRIRLAQPGGRDEQPAAGRPRRRRRHEPDVPELGPGAVDRDLLHADDHRPVEHAPPHAHAGLEAHGVPAATAVQIGHLPPVSVLFAAFLGYNPVTHLIPANVLAHLTAQQNAALSGRSFFPHLIADPFRSGLHEAFAFAIIACLIAAAASWSRGDRYVHTEQPAPPETIAVD